VSTLPLNEPSKRPGGRTAAVTSRIHQAILDVIVEEGIEACTFSKVAERAGVERSTLYRRYPDRWDAIIGAWLEVAGAEVKPTVGDSFAADLRSILTRLLIALESPLGPALLSVVAELRRREGNDFSRAFFDRRMEQLAPIFDAAIERGELAPDVDRELLFSLAAGPVYFRLFVAGRRIDDDFIDSIVQSICLTFGRCEAAKVSLGSRIP